jgi:SAM-dependent methyltransferase
VVDVGCGSGPLGLLLRGVPIRLFGFDRDESGLAHARAAGYETALGDLSDGALPAAPAPAQALVCADVLEHVPDPAALLPRLLQAYLPTGGIVIASLPNVAHWSVRLSLLLGRWQYADKGILDRTHMRFFTASTAAAFLRDAGVRGMRRRATSVPLPVVSDLFSPGRPLYPVHALSARLTNAWPGLLAYQFVFVGEWPERTGDTLTLPEFPAAR